MHTHIAHTYARQVLGIEHLTPNQNRIFNIRHRSTYCWCSDFTLAVEITVPYRTPLAVRPAGMVLSGRARCYVFLKILPAFEESIFSAAAVREELQRKKHQWR